MQLESALTVRVDEVRPSFAAGQPDEYERQDSQPARMGRTVSGRVGSRTVLPGTLPRYLDRHLHREPLREPFEWWRHQVESLDVEAS